MTGVHGNRLPESYPSAPCDVCRHLYRRATAVHLLGVGGGYPLRSPDGSFVGESRGEYGCWEQDGRLLVGYWVGREFWGRGLATAALAELVTEIPERPLHAWVASSNVGSIRVLEKCGFVEVERHAERDEHSGEVIGGDPLPARLKSPFGPATRPSAVSIVRCSGRLSRAGRSS